MRNIIAIKWSNIIKAFCVMTVITSCQKSYDYDETPESYRKEALANAETSGQPLFIKEFEIKHPNSAGGVAVAIKGNNFSGKTIKYINFWVTPYNSVGDRQVGEINGQSKIKLVETGPISTSSAFGSSSLWPNVWYNSQISCGILDQIQIEFMDGKILKIRDKKSVDALMRYDVKNRCPYVAR